MYITNHARFAYRLNIRYDRTTTANQQKYTDGRTVAISFSPLLRTERGRRRRAVPVGTHTLRACVIVLRECACVRACMCASASAVSDNIACTRHGLNNAHRVARTCCRTTLLRSDATNFFRFKTFAPSSSSPSV